MRPQVEFIALSAVAGGAAMVLATAADQAGTALPWTDSLKWVLPALSAAGMGAWLAWRWQRRRHGGRAGGMALRTLLLGACSYVPALMLYLGVVFAASADATQGSSNWGLFSLAFLFGCLPLLWAALPFSMIEFFLCRRYLRRTRVLAGSP
ncbi:hypothetical protein K8O61_06660 [Xanthomonas cerealis pv. cerealis]|uniref:hypothetical protein n=1 Tax=Xanthomonas cerealis TaxID=3390025 RepID=UPI001F4246C5|nr:hypothetical protein [Xanthomonas translucens]UKE70708.1 hypothetical protein K8O61_06660 [Xanthomonas translucens pv. pistacia]